MMMIFRRSEDWKERASRLHDVEEVLDIRGKAAASQVVTGVL